MKLLRSTFTLEIAFAEQGRLTVTLAFQLLGRRKDYSVDDVDDTI